MYIFYSLLLVSLLRITVGAEWCYESQFSCDSPCTGPQKWSEVVETCGGKSQSPINIVTQKAEAGNSLTPLRFRGYQDMFSSVITNNGHTGEFTWNQRPDSCEEVVYKMNLTWLLGPGVHFKVNLSGHALVDSGGLGGTYKAMELHFHWGSKGGPGSEHTLDGEQFPMEMHIVHIKDRYSSVSEAVTDPSGVAVLGILYQVSESTNKKYEAIINALANVTQQGNWSSLGPLSLEMLIPSNVLTYFRYTGSLTTPNCTEAVIWTVFENTVPLSIQQLSAFSDLKFTNGSAMVETFRPVQPLNGRKVSYFSGSNVVLVSNMLVVSSILTMLLNILE